MLVGALLALTVACADISFANAGTTPTNATPPASFPCLKADHLLERGLIDAAREAYVVVGERFQCAKDGVRATQAAKRACSLGNAELAAHRPDDALSAFKQALAITPAECAKLGLDRAGPDEASRTLKSLSGVVSQIPTVLAVIAVLVAVLFLALVLIGLPKVKGKRLPLEKIFGLRKLLRPRITIAPVVDQDMKLSEFGLQWTVGPSMTAQIKERLQSFREEALDAQSPDTDLDFGSSEEAIADLVSSQPTLKNALDKVGEIGGSTKIATALLELIYAALPIRRLSISGVLDPPSSDCASVTLSIESGAQLEASVTLKHPLADASTVTSADYMRLVDQTAVWVQFEMTRTLTGAKASPDQPESYARVREGLDRHAAHDELAARAAFEAALRLDPRNWSAAIDLAATEARLAGGYQRAIQLLERAYADIKEPRDSEPPPGTQGNYYRIGYQLAAQRMHLYLACLAGGGSNDSNGTPRAGPLAGKDLLAEASAVLNGVIDEATTKCNALCARMHAKGLKRLMFWQRLDPVERRLEAFLSHTLLPSAKLLLAGIAISQGSTDAYDEESIDLMRSDLSAADLPYRTAYNLACFEVSAAGLIQRQHEASLGMPPKLIGAPDRRCEQAVAACYDTALTALREALSGARSRRRRELGCWALRDPALDALRESTQACGASTYKERFKDLLDLYGITCSPPEPETAGPKSAATETKKLWRQRLLACLDSA